MHVISFVYNIKLFIQSDRGSVYASKWEGFVWLSIDSDGSYGVPVLINFGVATDWSMLLIIVTPPKSGPAEAYK